MPSILILGGAPTLKNRSEAPLSTINLKKGVMSIYQLNLKEMANEHLLSHSSL
ncbi:hypothetical protein LDG_6653 [Legionella drancourtii LLAP12]|uniref:Uncharacterized protein n=1 Tax=Legionella drancourtii LLAP12 TaxID=658187 RepID=G9EN32_9GAMM|nr:hypothetical protein LDG_6653 [Legionella drancourtii LLAP12]